MLYLEDKGEEASDGSTWYHHLSIVLEFFFLSIIIPYPINDDDEMSLQ